jgi:hypothetical protein
MLMPVVLTQAPPRTICSEQIHPQDQNFKHDCFILWLWATCDPDPAHLCDLSKWQEIPVPGSRRSTWSTTSGSCFLSFDTDSPLSLETWRTIIEDLEAIQHDCVNSKGVGGYRVRQLDHEQPVSKLKSVTVYITQLHDAPMPSQERQKAQNSGGKKHPSIKDEPLKRRRLPRLDLLDVPFMATCPKTVASTARYSHAPVYPRSDRRFRPPQSITR